MRRTRLPVPGRELIVDQDWVWAVGATIKGRKGALHSTCRPYLNRCRKSYRIGADVRVREVSNNRRVLGK